MQNCNFRLLQNILGTCLTGLISERCRGVSNRYLFCVSGKTRLRKFHKKDQINSFTILASHSKNQEKASDKAEIAMKSKKFYCMPLPAALRQVEMISPVLFCCNHSEKLFSAENAATMAININGDVEDIFYRYKMAKLAVKVEGRKTVLVNMMEIAHALRRPPPC